MKPVERLSGAGRCVLTDSHGTYLSRGYRGNLVSHSGLIGAPAEDRRAMLPARHIGRRFAGRVP
jgi:hypothetical protein